MPTPKDDDTKIREEQQRQEDEKKKEEDERKKGREAATKRMEESVPTPTQEELDQAVLAKQGGGEIESGAQTNQDSEAAPASGGTYSTRSSTPKEK